jgi:hypothetical protein
VISGGTLSGVVSGDTVTLTQAGTFSSANVGTGLAVTAANTIGGASAGNYTLTQPTGLTADITPAPLGIAVNATYNGSVVVAPTSFTINGLVNGETISGITNATLDNANVINNGSNFVATFTPAGGTANLGNYAINQGYSNTVGNTQNTATITAKSLTITANAVTAAIYGSAYALGTTAFTTSGLVGADIINAVTLSYGGSNTIAASTNAGSYSAAILPSNPVGSGLANYSINYIGGNLTVGKATLTFAPNAVDTVFNGSVLDNVAFSRSVSNYTVTGYKNTDSAANVPVTLTGSMSFSGSITTVVQDVAIYSMGAGTLAGISSNTNYTIAFSNTPNNVYKINPAILSITASKVYDGSTIFNASAINAVTAIGNQAVSLTGSATSNTSDVLTVSSLNTFGLSISNTAFANNYVLPTSTTNVSITQAPITVSISNQTKVYDATNTATLNAGSYSLSGFVSGQGATINQTNATYNSVNVVGATTVSTTLSNSNYIASGSTNLSNYTLPVSISGVGSITRATLTMSANAAAKFVGQADPALTYTLTGLKGADTSNVLLNPAISRQPGEVATSDPANNNVPYTITPSATAANYTIVPVTAGFTVVAQGQLLLSVANTSVTYGALRASNLAGAAPVMASYDWKRLLCSVHC